MTVRRRLTRGAWRVVAVVVALLVLRGSAGAAQVLVMPFENTDHDARLVWVGEAVALLLSDDVQAMGGTAVSRAGRLEALERLHIPGGATVTLATTFRVAESVGARTIVTGTVRMRDTQVDVRARVFQWPDARLTVDVTEQAPLAQLFAMVERIARRVAPGAPFSTDDVERTHPTVGAFEQYVKGVLAQSPATAINYLDAALREAPTFDEARLALWDRYDRQANHAQALAVVGGVPATSPHALPAQFRVGLSQLAMGRPSDAATTLRRLATASPTAPVLNNLGIAELRRGTAGGASPGAELTALSQAVAADASDADYAFNLGYAYALARDVSAAAHWLREALRRAPADADAHAVLASVLAASGRAPEAARERELTQRLSSGYDAWAGRAEVALPRGLERVKDVAALVTMASDAATGAPDGTVAEMAQWYLARATRLADDGRDQAAAEDVRRVLFLSPYNPAALRLEGQLHLRAGRVREAIQSLTVAVWADETADAHVLLARAHLADGDEAEAREDAERALLLVPGYPPAQAVIDALPVR